MGSRESTLDGNVQEMKFKLRLEVWGEAHGK